jgi:N-acylneuraminate cytidylyltransferase
MKNSIKIRSVALIPARSGSKRVPNKNIKPLGDGHPMLAYTIRAAIDSGEFDAVICATDSVEYAEIAAHYGAEVPFLRTSEMSGDKSPDIEWVVWMLEQLKLQNRSYEIFSILRPTNPFRLPETIQRAMKNFKEDGEADSLRAIEKCKQHPGKMWVINGKRILPIMPFSIGNTPWHSNQYTSLPEIYVQNASLESAWTKIALEQKTIAGASIIPFISKELEGFDINEPEDWLLAETYISNNKVKLPIINCEKFIKKITGIKELIYEMV